MPHLPVKTINIALQGGGSHGAFTWGVLDRLLEDGRVALDGVSATSAGAMNAVVCAHGFGEGGGEGARTALEAFWREVSVAGHVGGAVEASVRAFWQAFGVRYAPPHHALEMLSRSFSPYDLNPFDLNPLRDVLVRSVDFERLREFGGMKLRLCATNVRTGRVRIFKNHEISADAVLASACIPMMFKAVEVDGEHYWDGGYMGNPAIFPLIYDTDTPDVLIVHVNPINRPDVPHGAGEIYNRVNELSFNSSLMREMRTIGFVTKLIDEDWLKPEHKHRLKRVFVHAIRTDHLMAHLPVASKLDASWPFLTSLRDIGREAATAWLDEHFDQVGVGSSIDIDEAYL